MFYRAAALLSLVCSSVLIVSAKSETSQDTVSTLRASQRLHEKIPLTTTPNHKRELDLVQQTTYNEELYTDEHRPGGMWETPVSDDGYTIVTTVNDPDYNNPSNSADYMVRVLKYKRGWSQIGQDLKCLFHHATLANTNQMQWGGIGVSLSGDGKVLAIGTSGVGSFSSQVDRHLVGYVDVFYYDDVTNLWEARGSRLDGSTYGANVGDRFGAGVKLSQDGTGLLLSTDSCYRKSSAGNNHDSRIDRARGFEWNESTQDWDLIFGIEKQNNVVGPCASMYAYLDVLKSKDGTKWFYALSGYHHKYNSAYVYEEDRNTGISRGLGGVIDKAKYTQLFQDENGDLRSVSHNPCYPLSSCYYHTRHANQKSAWRHLKYNSSSNTWDQVQLFSGTIDGELFGHELSLSSDGRFAAAANIFNGFSNRIYEFNPNTFQFQELALTGTYPPRGAPSAILPMGDVITGQTKNGVYQMTRFVLDPGVNWAGGGGDPHFIGFGGIFFTWQGHCDVILVKTPKVGEDGIDLEVHVRTRRIRKWSAIDAVAFRIGHEIGEISSDEGKLCLNGSEVESFQTGTITVSKSNLKKKQKLYRIVFDNDKILEVEVNTRTKMIFANLKGAYPVGTVGILGSPDNPGLHSRDGTRMTKKETDTFVESWQVQGSDSQLFHQRRYPQFPSKCLYNMEETKVNGKRHLKEVHTVTMEDAKATCASHPPGPMREFCVEDVFQAGNLDFGEEQFYG